MAEPTVASHLVDALAGAGVRHIYRVVGDSLNSVTEAVRKHTEVDWIRVRHEETGAFGSARTGHGRGQDWRSVPRFSPVGALTPGPCFSREGCQFRCCTPSSRLGPTTPADLEGCTLPWRATITRAGSRDRYTAVSVAPPPDRQHRGQTRGRGPNCPSREEPR